MVAVGTVVRAENWIQTLRQVESLLDIRGRDGHAITRLMASNASSAVGTYALEERPRKVDPAARGAVSFRRATGIREKRSVRDERELLSIHSNNRYQRADNDKSPAEQGASGLTSKLETLCKKRI